MKKRVLACLAVAGSVVVLPLAVSGQAAEIPKPEFYGLYVVAEGKLYGVDANDAQLDGSRQPVHLARTESDFKSGGGAVAQVPELPGSLNLLVFVKGSPLQAAAQLKLQQLSFVRRMTINENDSSYRQTYQPNAWVAATDFGYAALGKTAIEFRFKPVKGEDEMVLAVPASPLKPGLYILGDSFIFGVAPIEAAASSRCIEAARAVGALASWRTWPCTEAPAAASGAITEYASAPSEGREGAPVAFDPGYILEGRNVVFSYNPVAYNFGGKISSVVVAGAFNGWATDSSRWRASDDDRDGRWTLVAYRGDVTCGSQFKFVVNGSSWQQPSKAWPSKYVADDGHGGLNMVVVCK